mmetsp:Transcript_34349/g.61912  ORF Transcript_34349/g.61912 Transcript_34349/m.61912 type:complete len:166 (-) Transcript_34349:117-614(-)
MSLVSELSPLITGLSDEQLLEVKLLIVEEESKRRRALQTGKALPDKSAGCIACERKWTDPSVPRKQRKCGSEWKPIASWCMACLWAAKELNKENLGKSYRKTRDMQDPGKKKAVQLKMLEWKPGRSRKQEVDKWAAVKAAREAREQEVRRLNKLRLRKKTKAPQA